MTEPDGHSIRRRGAVGVGVAAVVSGLCGYVVLLVVARSLTAPVYAEFLTFWGALFFCYGLLTGVQSDVTRAVASGRHADRSGTPVLPLLLAVTAGVVAAIVLTSMWGAPTLLGDVDLAARITALALGALAFSGHASVAGALGGSGRWERYGLLVAAEATARLVLVCVAAGAGASLGGFAFAVAGASATWLVLIALLPDMRPMIRARSDRDVRHTLRGWSHAVVAAGASAALIVGYPVLVRATSTDASFADAAPLLLAIMLTRGPILVPLGAYQNVVVAHVVGNDGRVRSILRLVPMATAVAVAIVVAGAAIGPWLLDVLRPGFEVSATMFAVLAASAVLLGVLTVTGAITLALDRHRAYSFGWITATVVSFAALLLPGGLDERIMVSVLLGPILGILVHVTGIVAPKRATVERTLFGSLGR